MDQRTERLLAATGPAEMEQMMATVLPFLPFRLLDEQGVEVAPG